MLSSPLHCPPPRSTRPRARGAQRSAGSGAAAGAAGLQPLQAKLQQHIDREDRRIKELTEGQCVGVGRCGGRGLGCAGALHSTGGAGTHPPTATRCAGILYHFFPEALRAVLPPGADPATGLDAEGARRVAVAALAVATLMNAPPGFLEFLLCMPWDALGPLYLRPEGPEGARLVPHLAESACEPSQGDLVNVRLDPSLIDCVLDFLYRPVGWGGAWGGWQAASRALLQLLLQLPCSLLCAQPPLPLPAGATRARVQGAAPGEPAANDQAHPAQRAGAPVKGGGLCRRGWGLRPRCSSRAHQLHPGSNLCGVPPCCRGPRIRPR